MTAPGRLAVIAGGSSGIGAATALALHRAGLDLHLVARRADELERLAEATGATWQALDLTEEASADSLAGALTDAGRVPAVVVYSAGLLEVARTDGHDVDLWDRILGVNLRGAFLTARALVPLMRPGGKLIFLSSVAGRKGQPGLGAYAASKAGLERWAESLGAELEPLGVAVHVVAPGPVATAMLDRPGASPHQLTPDAVAELIVWLTGLEPGVVLRDITLRAPLSGPFSSSGEAPS